jgi:hypothetical protein
VIETRRLSRRVAIPTQALVEFRLQIMGGEASR